MAMDLRRAGMAGSTAIAVLLAGCGDEGSLLPSGGASQGGSGGSGGDVLATGGDGSGGVPNPVTTVGGGGVGGSSYVCDPPAAPGSLYELNAETLGLEIDSMCRYRGDVLLIVNTAAV